MRLAASLLVAASAATAFADPTPRRDPTVPPPGYGAPAQAQAAAARDPHEAVRPEHIVIVDGKRFLVWRGHRYGVGDSVQGARIERLEETEVWLRTAQGVRKLALFPGIRKSPPEPTKGQPK